MGMARSSSKTKEKELIKLAKRLAKNPLVVLPECTPDCDKDPFARVTRSLERIKEAAEDEELLKKLSKKGDPLARAVAGTILLKHAGKVPMLAVFRTPWGEASYAMRGKTTKERLVGVQNMDHPIWRLFSVIDIVKKKRVYVYSGKKKMVCTGRAPHPPKDFVDWDLRHLPYHLNRSGRIHSCKHLKAEEVEKGVAEGKAYLHLHWISADRVIALCEQCAGKENTPALLSRYMAGPRVIEDFEIDVRYRPVCGIEDCSQCQGEWGLERQDLKEYRKARLTDLELIQRGKKAFENSITGGGTTVYMAGGICYGKDRDAFIDSLRPDEIERAALEAALEAHDGSLITDGVTPGKILSILWEEHGKRALNAVTGDPELSEELIRGYDPSKTSVSSILHEGAKLIKIHAVLSTLPEYSSLPKDWEFADGVARSYRTGGKEEALKVADKHKNVSKALAWAFLRAIDASAGKEWMFNEIERELGNAVKEQARGLLQAESTDYHKALSELMRAVGSSSTEVEPSGKNR